MCGIVGIVGASPVMPRILEALRRLEYRGYDSAGIATLDHGKLRRVRSEGKLRNLDAKLAETPLEGWIGIGHTRWATHGRPSENNAHPHASDRLAVVHNGIIENFRSLREELAVKGYRFTTETDTEIAVLLVTEQLERGLSPHQAVCAAIARMRGAFALVYMFRGEDNLLIGVRQGAPLAVGRGQGEMFLGSDALALAPFTDQIAYLEDGDVVSVTRESCAFCDVTGQERQRAFVKISPLGHRAEKGPYRHFMLKEIHEQPEVIGHTITHYADLATQTLKPYAWPCDPVRVQRISIIACGTAYMAGLVAKYWFERFARLPVEVDIASEYRYREPPVDEGGLVIAISQSGETADTLAGLKYAKDKGAHTMAVVNVLTSSLARLADVQAPTLAGPEIGVASTKAFTCQLVVLAALALSLAKARGLLDEDQEMRYVAELAHTPRLVADVLKRESNVERLAQTLTLARDALYLGRGLTYPLALEGALKLKELSYIHAEGYAAGELKHGPIALIDAHMPVIVLCPHDAIFEKTLSNMQEVSARGGRILLIGDAEVVREAGIAADNTLVMPAMPPLFVPIVYAVPLQLLAYHAAVLMGKDADQPRNLAKSVTVE